MCLMSDLIKIWNSIDDCISLTTVRIFYCYYLFSVNSIVVSQRIYVNRTYSLISYRNIHMMWVKRSVKLREIMAGDEMEKEKAGLLCNYSAHHNSHAMTMMHKALIYCWITISSLYKKWMREYEICINLLLVNFY